ncbi:MAG: FHA domain-containing protein [Myxococcota bacterium]
MTLAQPAYFDAVASTEPKHEASAARLIEVDEHGRELGPTYPLLDEQIVLGRSRACGLQLRQDGEVSRQHCELKRIDDRWMLRDLGATHGVRVNARLVVKHILCPGDTVRIGQTTLRFLSVAH